MKLPFLFSGVVKEGKKRGRKLGFPTANIALEDQIPSGIYVSLTEIEGKEYPSLTFIGEAKTFDEHLFQAETWILDFTKNIYGAKLTVKLLKKIRDNQKFESAEDLVKQMYNDEKLARLALKKMLR